MILREHCVLISKRIFWCHAIFDPCSEYVSEFDLAPCNRLQHLFILSATIFSHHALWDDGIHGIPNTPAPFLQKKCGFSEEATDSNY